MKKNYFSSKIQHLKHILCAITLLISYSTFTQTITLDFTIDTASDDTVSITETIIDGSDTYVLLISHPGNEELDDLGGGDLIFFLGSGGAISDMPYVISLTKNGNSVNFTLNSIDYDTLGAGLIALENQNGDVISSQMYPLGSGAVAITNTANASDISSFSIIPDLGDPGNELNDFGFHNINIDVQNTLSVGEEIIDEVISISPNPSEGKVLINTNAIEIDNLEVLDLNGRSVKVFKMNKTLRNEELDLTTLLPGIYLMRVVSSNNTTSIRKIIIQ